MIQLNLSPQERELIELIRDAEDFQLFISQQDREWKVSLWKIGRIQRGNGAGFNAAWNALMGEKAS